eukprot:c4933_g1_i1.p1 GENE.c4933_g1_i1~~c4933_g1_i1.p1  ORF type:complete len:229 (+),score=59.09 c4933_g1_i1:40-726(+)
MGDDEAIIRKRFLFEGGRPLKKLCTSTLQLVDGLFHENANWNALYDSTQLDLVTFQDTTKRLHFINSRNSREIEDSEKLQKSIEDQIKWSENEIERLKVQLVEEQRLREHKEECERIVKLINQHPSRAELESGIDSLKKEISDLEKKKEKIETKEDTRRKQFHLVIQAMHALEAELEDEETKREKQDEIDASQEEVVIEADRDEVSEQVVETAQEADVDDAEMVDAVE